jgi:ABC-type sugar transport system ATPase subunit
VFRRSACPRARGITKRFENVLALDGVDFDLRPGEVHALGKRIETLSSSDATEESLARLMVGRLLPFVAVEITKAGVSRRSGRDRP